QYVGSWSSELRGTRLAPTVTFSRNGEALKIEVASDRTSGPDYDDVVEFRAGRVTSVDPLTVDWIPSDSLSFPYRGGGPVEWSEVPAAHEGYDGPLSLPSAPDGGRFLTIPSGLAEEIGTTALAQTIGWPTPNQLKPAPAVPPYPWVGPRD